MTYLALDRATGDLILPDSGGVTRVTEGRFVVQQVQSKLRTGLGEWLLDPAVGWLDLSDFEKHFDKYDIESRATKIILQTDNVLKVVSMESTYSKRKLSIRFVAETVYGNIDLTVPWSL